MNEAILVSRMRMKSSRTSPPYSSHSEEGKHVFDDDSKEEATQGPQSEDGSEDELASIVPQSEKGMTQTSQQVSSSLAQATEPPA